MYLHDHQREVRSVEKVGRVYANGFTKINNGEIKFKFYGEGRYFIWKTSEISSHLNVICRVVNIKIFNL
jgi:hypothetical protein